MVAIVYLTFGQKRVKDDLNDLKKLVMHQMGAQQKPYVVIVDNASEVLKETQKEDNVFLIAGDNSCHEFSGYDKGLNFLLSQNISLETPVIIANDTFSTNYGNEYLNKFNQARYEQMLNKEGLMGWMDAFPQEVSLFSFKFKEWIRTSFIVGKLKLFRSLQPLALKTPDEYIFSKNYREFFSEDCPLDKRYQGYLKNWLFLKNQKPSDFQHEWHSKQALTAANFDKFKIKTRCILSEHLLTNRAFNINTPIFNARTNQWIYDNPT
jgi:hypothetical protein